MSGYYIQTDILKYGYGDEFHWVTDEEEEDVLNLKDTPFRSVTDGERFYWNGDTKTMDGAVERAKVYATEEEAESEALIAASLDPNLAGHLHIVPEAEALRTEKGRIEERKREAARAALGAQNRFRLGSKEGGI